MASRERRSWSEEEDQLLRDAVELEEPGTLNPSKWHLIAKHVPSRTNKDCRKRWFAKMASDVVKGGWAPEEDQKLVQAIEKYGTRWSQVSEYVQTRNSDQCAKRWTDTLNPMIDRTRWSAEADSLLLKAVQEHGKLWTKIARTYFPGRTGLAAKNRYNSITRFNAKAPRRKTYKPRAKSESASSTCSTASSCPSDSPSISSSSSSCGTSEPPSTPPSSELNLVEPSLQEFSPLLSELAFDPTPWSPMEGSSSSLLSSPLTFDQLCSTTSSSLGLFDSIPNVADFSALHPILTTQDASLGTSLEEDTYSHIQQYINMCSPPSLQLLETFPSYQPLDRLSASFSPSALSLPSTGSSSTQLRLAPTSLYQEPADDTQARHNGYVLTTTDPFQLGTSILDPQAFLAQWESSSS